ncbi:DnaJ domain-containing protein [Oceanivirga miroungae]|uniref:Chaperone protein DnaJ n=1 Tax=Oceanivirga miroungae TaxID=1130046 RepID=A0A6I8MCG6_9FUSO|nr:DnaJ domain-containing protein [Oceanivirga miroungae]VWL85934.1 Chaperone protein DnaJ [Oceanivirga miroungae]
MFQLLAIFFIGFVLVLSVILSLPYEVHLVLALISLLWFKNPLFAIIFFVIAFIRYNNRKSSNFEFNFRTNRRINEEEFYEFFNNTHNEYNSYSNFNQNIYKEDEYEKACNELGMDKSMSYDEKKKIYKKLLLKYHPDINKTTEALEMSQKINKYWDIIEKYEKSN